MNIIGRTQISRVCVAVGVVLISTHCALVANAQSFSPIYTEAELEQITPFSADPYRAFLTPGTEPDYDYWQSRHYWNWVNTPPALQSRATTVTTESEPNNFPFQAQDVPLGTGGGDFSDVIVEGTFTSLTFVQTNVQEENGSIPTAIQTGLSAREVTAALSTIGDGIHGSSGTQQGDFDFYATDSIPAGSFIEAEITTADGGLSFSSFLTIWSSSGEILEFDGGANRDASISFKVPSTGIYYISVGGYHRNSNTGGTGFFNDFPRNPFEAGSGAGHGDEGDYNITIRISDTDYVQVDLQAGDVVALSSESFNSVALEASLENLAGTVLLSSTRARTFLAGGTSTALYPDSHPYVSIPGTVHGPYVIAEDGTYRIAFRGSSPFSYEMDLRVRRPILETDPVSIQTIYLDMGNVEVVPNPEDMSTTLVADRVLVDSSLFFDVPSETPDKSLTPLIGFFDTLMIEIDESDDDENVSKLNTFDEFAEQIREYVDSKLPGNVQVLLGARPSGERFVASQVYVAGTAAEIGQPLLTGGLLGISETIDPGNFEFHDEAVVLIGEIAPYAVSTPFFFFPTGDAELDEAEESRVRRELYVVFIGNVILHELGHFLGNFHTVSTNSTLNIMDQGGTIQNLIGSGDDGVFNSGDELAVPEFRSDFYADEFFTNGIEDSEAVVVWGVNAFGLDVDLSNLYVDYEASEIGIGTSDKPYDHANPAVTRLLTGGTINIYTSEGVETFSGVSTIDKPMTIRNETPESGPVRIIGGN